MKNLWPLVVLGAFLGGMLSRTLHLHGWRNFLAAGLFGLAGAALGAAAKEWWG